MKDCRHVLLRVVEPIWTKKPETARPAARTGSPRATSKGEELFGGDEAGGVHEELVAALLIGQPVLVRFTGERRLVESAIP